MKKFMPFFGIAAILLAGSCAMGCDGFSEEEIVPQPVEQFVTLTTTVSIEKPATKAVGADGAKTFEAGDRMAVVINGAKYVSEALVAADISNEGKSARFTVKNVNNPQANQDVKYIYPASAADENGAMDFTKLATQNGTHPSKSNPVDFGQFTGNLTSNAQLPAATLSNPLTLVKFTIKNAENNDITSTVTQLIVSDGTNTYTVNLESVADTIWVAMQPVMSGDISFTALAGTDAYSKEVTGKTLDASSLYPIKLKMDFDPLRTPLTFEAKTAGATITFAPSETYAANAVEYSTDGGKTWNDCAAGASVKLTNVGDKVAFHGSRASYATNSTNYSHFSSSEDCYFYGNVMSLVDSSSFAEQKKLTANYAFCGLFRQDASNEKLKNHASKKLVLPATTLKNYCYSSMFQDCKGLTVAPELPAETLASYCYTSMFQSTGLTAAPALPAQTLTYACYQKMFNDCNMLTSITCFATNINADNSTNNWLKSVASNGTFTTPTETGWSTGPSGIPDGWTRKNYE